VSLYMSKFSRCAINCRCCNGPDHDGSILRKPTGGSGYACHERGPAGERRSSSSNRRRLLLGIDNASGCSGRGRVGATSGDHLSRPMSAS
jgi:hypothetical protein